jgi:hypothetical protein
LSLEPQGEFVPPVWAAPPVASSGKDFPRQRTGSTYSFGKRSSKKIKVLGFTYFCFFDQKETLAQFPDEKLATPCQKEQIVLRENIVLTCS